MAETNINVEDNEEILQENVRDMKSDDWKLKPVGYDLRTKSAFGISFIGMSFFFSSSNLQQKMSTPLKKQNDDQKKKSRNMIHIHQ